MQVNRNMIAKPIQGNTPVNAPANTPVNAPVNAHEGGDFRSIMESVSAGNRAVQFSKHANMRLNARNIHLYGEQMRRIEDGIARAQGKGIRDSLVLVDNIALVVNVANKVVVTALSQQEHQQDQVFTNIDGAVIV